MITFSRSHDFYSNKDYWNNPEEVPRTIDTCDYRPYANMQLGDSQYCPPVYR